MDTVPDVRERLLAAYALRATNEEDVATFKAYLDQYGCELVELAVTNLLAYLGMDDGVEVEIVHLTNEQKEKLEKSGMLEDYLNGKGKLDD